MENDVSENVESTIEDYSQSSEVPEGVDEVSSPSDVGSDSDILDNVSSEGSEDVIIEESLSENFSEEVIEEDKPSSTVIQVEHVEGSDDEYTITELDVESLNIMSESYVESMLAVTPTSNDYYTFIDSTIEDYFSGIMANYPLNEYKAYHLRHYVYNTSYSSYYDDYYYLFYDYPNNSCLELYKPYNSSSYNATWGSAEILDSTISYGSEVGWSDLREGVNYVSWLSALGVLACVCVLYIVHAIFKHLHS